MLSPVALRSRRLYFSPARHPSRNRLPSWNEGAAKKSILDFVAKVTEEGGPDFVPVAERIAVFDNDGTLWCEQPIYVQMAFAFDRIKVLAPQHPSGKTSSRSRTCWTAICGRSARRRASKACSTSLRRRIPACRPTEFDQIVNDWLKTARHPRFSRPYTELVYQPMLELLAYLRATGFKTYIVSGGGIDFMRPWTEKSYGIPPEQVIGSTGKVKYELRDGKPVLMKLPEINFIDDGPGKPVGIYQVIGRRPVMAFGNSDGDFEMLQYTTGGGPGRAARRSFGLIVHHTDAEREYAYDRKSPIGRLDKALDEAPRRGWTVVNMKTDWKTIFPFD